MKTDPCRYYTLLKANRLKLTPRRKAVVEIFLARKTCLGPARLLVELKKRFQRVGLPGVYRICEELKGAGILVKVDRGDQQLHYGLCRHPGKDHHHFVCRKCHRLEEVDFCNFDEIARFVEKKLGARVQHHALRIEGLCARCR